jgi:hypothetical protein
MSFKVTLIVESTHDSGNSKNTMEKTVEGGSDNERFYPSQAEHTAVGLIRWAEGKMTNLVGGRDVTLVDHDAKMVVNQRAFLDATQQAQAFRDFKKAQGDQALVNVDELKRLKWRDALLSAMEAAGVDNWEGMEHIDRPEEI